MDAITAIRPRRTQKAYEPRPLDRALLLELLELARWAPNHNLTEPWQLRVLGPGALERLKQASGPEQAAKLDRCPTLVICSCRVSGDPVQDEEDLHATACAIYAVMLGAHARGIASYWRTPDVLREPAGRQALGLGPDERPVALLHLGYGKGEKPAPGRSEPGEFVTFLD
jgi:nitroreductase